MTTTYLVLAHDDLHGLKELGAALAPAPVIAHLDRPFATNLTPAQVEDLRGEGIAVVPEPVCVHWGGYSVHEAMVRLLAHGLETTDSAHFTFLSGRCFPLRPPAEFEAFLAERPGVVLCRAFPLSEGTGFMGLDRVRKRHLLDGAVGHLRKRSRRIGGSLRKALLPVLSGSLNRDRYDVHCGSQWMTVPRALALELVAHHRAGGFAYLEDSFAPDEMAFQTYIHTSQWSVATLRGGAEPWGGRAMAEFSNAHWLRGSLQGEVTASEVEDALANPEAYFIRKLPPGAAGRKLRKLIRASWPSLVEQ